MGFGGSGGGSASISGASDAALNNPASNDVLSYDTSVSKWRNNALTSASTSTRGVVQLASNAETSAGTVTNKAITPSALGALPQATADDIMFDETRTVAQVINELLTFKASIEGDGVPLSASVAPVVSGSFTQGASVSTSNGTWSQTPDSFSYQWLRSSEEIPGATSNTYTLTGADVGTNTISVRVTAVKSGFTSGSAISNTITVSASAAPLSYGTPSTGGINSGTTVTIAKPSGVTTGDKLYAILSSDINSGGSDWSAVAGSGTWSRIGPAWPGSSAANRIFGIYEHSVTNAAGEPANYQFTRSGVNGRNAGAIIPVHGTSGVDVAVTDYLGASITNGRRTESLTVTTAGSIQFFVATKFGTSTSAQNPTTTPTGFTEIVNEAINDGSGTSNQVFLYAYAKSSVGTGATGTFDIAWSAGATNPIAQSFVVKVV